jgi:hypothetical protein
MLNGNSGFDDGRVPKELSKFARKFSHGADLYEKDCIPVTQLNKRHPIFSLALYEVGTPFQVKT